MYMYNNLCLKYHYLFDIIDIVFIVNIMATIYRVIQ